MISKIKLQNWKSHSETELEFKPGINVLVGPMGSGKSSVLQAICFALFGSVPEVKRRDVKVSELVKRNSGTQASIELKLDMADKVFQIQRIINSKGTEATVRDADGVMLAGTNSTQATAFLKNILKLDEDTFLRTVYAKQNEIDLFLQLNPQERKTRLDELMGVHKFEAARRSCVSLANKIANRKEEKENLLKNFEIDKLKAQIDSLQNEISMTSEEKDAISNKIASAQRVKLDAESELKELKVKFDVFARLEERQKFCIAQINDIKLRLKEPIRPQAEIISQLDELKSKIASFENTRFELNKALDSLNKRLMISEKESSVAESKLSDAKIQLEKISAYKLELEQLTQKFGIEDAKGELERVESEIKEQEKEIFSAESETRFLKKHLEELKSAKNACPTCSRALEEGTKEKLVAERESSISVLSGKIESAAVRRAELASRKDKLDDFIEQRDELLSELKKEPDLMKQHATYQAIFESAKSKIESSAQEIEKSKSELDSAERALNVLRREDSELREQLHLAELKEQLQQFEAQLTEVQAKLSTKPDNSVLETADSNFRKKFEQFMVLNERQKSLDYVLDEKRKHLSELIKKQNQSEQLLLDMAQLQKKVEFLQQFRSALLVAQELLRKELITAVNEVMASLWSKLYPYEKWTSIHLDASDTDYTLQLRTSEGTWVNVAGFASGGERMLAALVLRLAFAKVLAPEFNILILDEPTHNLDDATISSFMMALQEHLPEFLEQLFIVTHEEKLAEVGNNIIRLN
jgi:exonuclease SbcC